MLSSLLVTITCQEDLQICAHPWWCSHLLSVYNIKLHIGARHEGVHRYVGPLRGILSVHTYDTHTEVCTFGRHDMDKRYLPLTSCWRRAPGSSARAHFQLDGGGSPGTISPAPLRHKPLKPDFNQCSSSISTDWLMLRLPWGVLFRLSISKLGQVPESQSNK